MLPCIIEPVKKGINTAPNEADKAADKLFREVFETYSKKESAAREIVRKSCLTSLETIALGLSIQAAALKGLSAADAISAGCRVCPFGSYRLGVHGPDADLDVVVLAPRHLTRDEFFPALCEALSAHPHVVPGSIRPLLDAFVPIVKALWVRRAGDTQSTPLDVDILFCRFDAPSLPPIMGAQYLLSNAALQGAGGDARGVASLNGVRVNEALLALLESARAGGVFHDALRAMRVWAVRRGVYGHQQGFLGGVQLSIIAALSCLLYPTATALRTLERSFYLMSHWKWPQPVQLVRAPSTADLRLGYPVRQYGDVQAALPSSSIGSSDVDILPILTPCAPVVNTAYNVSRSSARAIRAEWSRAWKVLAMAVSAPVPVENIASDEASFLCTACIHALFEPAWPAYVRRYTHYVAVVPTHVQQLNGTGTGSGRLDAAAWLEYVQSRIRHLPTALEAMCPRAHAVPTAGLPDTMSDSIATPALVSLTIKAHLYPDPMLPDSMQHMRAAASAASGGIPRKLVFPDGALCMWLIGLDVAATGSAAPNAPLLATVADAFAPFASDVYRGWLLAGNGASGRSTTSAATEQLQDLCCVSLSREEVGMLSTLAGWKHPSERQGELG